MTLKNIQKSLIHMPSSLKFEFYESMQNYGASLVLAVLLLYFTPWGIDQYFSYFVATIFLTSLLMPFIERWRPGQKISANGKAVFVSGCGSGFGYSIAQQLDKLGFEVYAACHSVEKEGPQQLKRLCSERLHLIPLEVTSDESVEKAVHYVKSTIGKKKLWALVNNAGIYAGCEIAWSSMDEIQHIVEVNTLGTIRLTKAFLPLLMKAKGRILTVSSAAGRCSLPLMVPYCLSKQASITFSEGLRLEMYRFGIKVITIEPFFYKTPLINEERVICYILKLWNKSPKYIQQFYPNNYEQLLKQIIHRTITWSTRENVEEVVECIEDAIVTNNPKYVYQPGTLTWKIQYWLNNVLPKQWMNIVVHLYTYPHFE